LLCRFYGYTIAGVRDLTMTQFNNLLSDISVINKLENGSNEDDKKGAGSPEAPACVSPKLQRQIARKMFGGNK